MTDFNRVTPKQITDLMARVSYRIEQPQGTTSTFVHAFLDDKFYLASGHSACVDARMFDAVKGIDMARKSAETKAEHTLWQFEGYLLYSLTVATETVTQHFDQKAKE